jgi:hypothetical protein
MSMDWTLKFREGQDFGESFVVLFSGKPMIVLI